MTRIRPRRNYTNSAEPPDHALGRSRGGLSTKIHQLVDGTGLPLVIACTPGQAGDSPMLLPLLAGLRVRRPDGPERSRPAGPSQAARLPRRQAAGLRCRRVPRA
jgi:hypothetical protein